MRKLLPLFLLLASTFASARQLPMPDGTMVEIGNDAIFVRPVFTPGNPPRLVIEEVILKTSANGKREESVRTHQINCSADQCEKWRFEVDATIRRLTRDGW